MLTWVTEKAIYEEVDLKIDHTDFWDSLHGQVPGLLDWDLGNECFLRCITTHLAPAEKNLVRYRIQIVAPPTLPLAIKPNPDGDGPNFEPNPWMWVNPNIVYPPGELEVPVPRKEEKLPLPCHLLPSEEEDSSCSDITVVEPLLPASSEQSPQKKCFASSPRNQELTEEEEAEDQDDSSSVALPSPHQRAPLQNQRLQQSDSQEGRLWPRPPLNYFHLIALALRNSPPCGLNVQQIYNFARQHFPFFRTAPEGWKNTVRHNLCFRESFEKVPASMQGEASTRPRSCLWRLTEEGHHRFEEEAHTFDSTRLEQIQQCMSQPGMMNFLFDFL
ncbi:PREDICTED: forkhead box protein R1 [Chrysochloris asiatica]|uniref:Forkhead box protein R1 n=1 Tax=Chrysochloris asiatica TaxID=185453 RepID=A0A9B0T8Q2_CHRAS|nr:PREDICTED: forkhead box protein R1 [Chrysochloris asiatica]